MRHLWFHLKRYIDTGSARPFLETTAVVNVDVVASGLNQQRRQSTQVSVERISQWVPSADTSGKRNPMTKLIGSGVLSLSFPALVSYLERTPSRSRNGANATAPYGSGIPVSLHCSIPAIANAPQQNRQRRRYALAQYVVR